MFLGSGKKPEDSEEDQRNPEENQGALRKSRKAQGNQEKPKVI